MLDSTQRERLQQNLFETGGASGLSVDTHSGYAQVVRIEPHRGRTSQKNWKLNCYF